VSPLTVSLRVVALALVFVVPVGGALGYFLARGRGALRSVLDALVLVPLVLPPSVVGYLLLVLFGKQGPLGAALDRAFGVRLVFSTAGAALAAAAVALPLMAKGAEAAFARIDHTLEEVALANGLPPLATFRLVTLPLALPGLGIAVTLAALRALGEFGATLTFAGYVPERTGTAPLEVYFAMQLGDDARAFHVSLALVGVSIAAALLLRVWGRSHGARA
jgi:molybdate transport system permease protein